MSAVFGQVRFDGAAVAEADIARMGRAMASRAPDGRALFVDGAIGLGHGLLRVVREDAFDQQPLYDRAAGLVLVADLRLDNREELAAALQVSDEALAELPDSALLLCAWRAWGEACVERLVGDFAFAVWDARARRLVLARDPMGQRQLFYHLAPDRIVFATEIEALWAAGVTRALRQDSLATRAYILVRSPPGETIFTGIAGLSGGTTMTVTCDATVARRHYWEPKAAPRHLDKDEGYYVAAYRAVLEEAVACRVRRLERPPGLSFSGGFDSGAIAGLAGPALAASGLRMVAATSVSPPGVAGRGDPRRWVEACARDMPHLDLRLVAGQPPDVLGGLDAAIARSTSWVDYDHAVHHALATTLAQGGARLVMDGYGGDYTLNPRGAFALAEMAANLEFGRLPGEILAHRRATGHGWRRTLWSELVRPLLPYRVRRAWARLRYGSGADAVLLAPGAPHATMSADQRIGLEGSRRAFGTPMRMRRLSRTILRRLQESSVSPLATFFASYGLEVTRPFHDTRVVELALAIPASYRVREGRDRYLACRALADIYPSVFLTRPRGNDNSEPGFLHGIADAAPALLAELGRLAHHPGAACLDLDRAAERLREVSATLTGEPSIDEARQIGLALQTLTYARFLERFAQTNASASEDAAATANAQARRLRSKPKITVQG